MKKRSIIFKKQLQNLGMSYISLFNMKKYRLLEITYPNDTQKYYYIQRKFLFLWLDICPPFVNLFAAKYYLQIKRKGTQIKTKKIIDQ